MGQAAAARAQNEEDSFFRPEVPTFFITLIEKAKPPTSPGTWNQFPTENLCTYVGKTASMVVLLW